MTTPPSFDLTGRVALVTGASSGLGERFATILAASGAAVVLAARRTDRLEQLCATINASGGRAAAVAMDVADEASTIAAYDAAEATFGTVDTIIANAGMNSVGPVIDLAIEEFDRVLAVNMRGVFLTVREGARRLLAAGSAEKENGRAVIISSITGHKVDAGLAVYSATKAGVLQMGKVMARDWVRKGINVNMICPGYIKTEINGDWFDTDAGDKQVQKFHRRRLAEPTDLDAMLLYLSSDASRGVTGAAFTIDDGQSL